MRLLTCADIVIMSLLAYATPRPALEAFGYRLRTYPIVFGWFQTASDAAWVSRTLLDLCTSLSPEDSGVEADLVLIPCPSWLLLGAPLMGIYRVYLFCVSPLALYHPPRLVTSSWVAYAPTGGSF